MRCRFLLLLALTTCLPTQAWSVDLATLRGHAVGRSLALEGDLAAAQDAWDRLLHGSRGDIHALPIARTCGERELQDALEQFRNLAPVWVAGGEGDCHVLLWGAFDDELEARSMASALPSSLLAAAPVLLGPPLDEMSISTEASKPTPSPRIARREPQSPAAEPAPTPVITARKAPAEPRSTDQPPTPRQRARQAQPEPPTPTPSPKPRKPAPQAQAPAAKPRPRSPSTRPATTPRPTPVVVARPRTEEAPRRASKPIAAGQKLTPTPSPFPTTTTVPPVTPPADLYADKSEEEQASLLFRDGNAAWTDGDFPVAIGFFEAALAIDPDNSRTLNNLGTAWLRHGSPTDAEKALRRAIAINPGYARAHLNLSTALYAQQRAAEAMDFLRTVIELEPANIDAYYNLAAVMAEGGLWSEAKTTLEAGLKVSKDHAGLLSLLEDIDRQLRAQKADSSPCEVGAASVSLRLRKAQSRFEAGVQAIRQGKFGDAIFELEASLACDPTSPETAERLGTARRGIGDLTGAQGAYELAAQHGSLEAKANLALVLNENGDCTGAIETLRGLTSTSPEFVNGWYFLGAMLHRCGQPSDAEAAALSGLEAIPGDPSLQKLLGALRSNRIGPGN